MKRSDTKSTFTRLVIKVTLMTLIISTCGGIRPAIADMHPLKIGLTGVIVQENLRLNEPLVDYIGEKLGINTTLVLRDTYEEMNHLLEQSEVDIAFVCGLPYIIGEETFGLDILAVPQINGAPEYFSYIIVPKDSPATRLEDLRGKKYAYSDPLSNSGNLAPRYRLAKIGETPETFFNMFVYTRSHHNSIEAVATKLVDGASVDSYIWEFANATDPIFTSETKIIEKGPAFPFTPFVMRKGIDPALQERITDVFLNMHHDPKGLQILESLKIDKFVAVPDSFYDPIRNVRSYVEEKTGKDYYAGE